MKKNKSHLKQDNFNWFSLNKEGYILYNNDITSSNILLKKAGVYIYQLLSDKNTAYIGSSHNIAKRVVQHRYSANNNINSCPKFYNSVKIHGWNNFRLAVIEYIDISKLDFNNKCNTRKVILDREQYYLDKMNPVLNINKTAGSMLGYKLTEEVRIARGLRRKAISINWKKEGYTVSEATKNKISLGAKGIKVKVFNKDNNIVNVFPTITSAALYYDISNNTLSKYMKTGYSINNLRFEAEIKDVRVWVFDKQRNLVGVFPTANKAAKFCGVYHMVLHRFLKSGRLLYNKYYFSKTNSCI